MLFLVALSGFGATALSDQTHAALCEGVPSNFEGSLIQHKRLLKLAIKSNESNQSTEPSKVAPLEDAAPNTTQTLNQSQPQEPVGTLQFIRQKATQKWSSMTVADIVCYSGFAIVVGLFLVLADIVGT
mmetsp:Transcript_72711/g.115103  ORF Transcript_72711/g.115103 Transcript_72711/m.115103 type:complete len:128 (+) Transcript_72711:111-494(+)